MLRGGMGKNNGVWFVRLDLWFWGFRLSGNKPPEIQVQVPDTGSATHETSSRWFEPTRPELKPNPSKHVPSTSSYRGSNSFTPSTPAPAPLQANSGGSMVDGMLLGALAQNYFSSSPAPAPVHTYSEPIETPEQETRRSYTPAPAESWGSLSSGSDSFPSDTGSYDSGSSGGWD